MVRGVLVGDHLFEMGHPDMDFLVEGDPDITVVIF